MVQLRPTDEPLVVPVPPRGLLKSTRETWFAFFSTDVARAVDVVTDAPALRRWIRALDEYERVEAVFKSARLVKGSKSQPVMNPLASYLADLEATISHLETQFGLTPMARLKLGIAVGQAAMTAAQLNARVDELPHEVDPDIDDEWAPA